MRKLVIPILCVLVLSTIPFAGSQVVRKPDLIVSKVDVVMEMQTNTTTIKATIFNQGNANTGSGFDVKLTVSDAGIGIAPHNISQTVSCPALPAKGACLAIAIFNGTDWYNFYANADVNDAVDESNENNNTSGWCAWVTVVDFGETYMTDLYVGNITTYPANIELVVDSVSPGMNITLTPSVVSLGPGEITQVLMTVEFEPGFTGGQAVIVGVYDDGYTLSPATIEFIG